MSVQDTTSTAGSLPPMSVLTLSLSVFVIVFELVSCSTMSNLTSSNSNRNSGATGPQPYSPSTSDLRSKITNTTDPFEGTQTISLGVADDLRSQDSFAAATLVLVAVRNAQTVRYGIGFLNYTGQRPPLNVSTAKVLISGKVTSLTVGGNKVDKDGTGVNRELFIVEFPKSIFSTLPQTSGVQIKLYGKTGDALYTLGNRERQALEVFLTYLREHSLLD